MAAPSLSQLYGDCIRSSGNDPCCDDFFRTVRPVLARVIYRVVHQYNSPDDIEDILQDVNLKLIASGTAIAGALPLDPAKALAYFCVIAANAARDVFRSRRATRRNVGATVALNGYADMAGGFGLSDYDRDLLVERIETMLPQDPRERTVFRLYYRQGFTAKEIASIPALALSTKGVESLILRVTKHVRKRMRVVS